MNKHAPDAMLAAFRRVPLGQVHDVRKLKRWVNTIWNHSHVLRAAGEFSDGIKPNHNAKKTALRKMVRIYQRAAS